MLTSFYTAVSGALSSQEGLRVTANNIANLSTTGYKADRASFSDLLYTNVRAAEAGGAGLSVGHGARLNSTDTVFDEGAPVKTGRDCDFAVSDENGFFAVLKDGGVQYTRDGSFHLSAEGATKEDGGIFRLVNAQGYPVLDKNLSPVYTESADGPMSVGVFGFRNKGGLLKTGGNCFSSTAQSGEAQAIQEPGLMQGFLESSSVDTGTEMAQTIIAERAFALNARIVQTSDEIMQTLNSLR